MNLDVHDLVERFWNANDSVPAALALIDAIINLFPSLSQKTSFLKEVAARERDPKVQLHAANLLAQMTPSPAVVFSS